MDYNIEKDDNFYWSRCEPVYKHLFWAYISASGLKLYFELGIVVFVSLMYLSFVSTLNVCTVADWGSMGLVVTQTRGRAF